MISQPSRKTKEQQDLFYDIKEKIQDMDPVYWCEKNLTIDGRPFRISDNGWKPFVDMYRYLGITAVSGEGKPVVFCKSRQVGGTSTGLFLELFLLASGKYGRKGKPPMRIMHAFPLLETAARYSKTKLSSTIATSRPVFTPKNKNKPVPFLETRLDSTIASKDSLSFKQFEGGSHLFIESTGLDGSRLRGLTLDVIFYDEVQLMREEAIGNTGKSLTAAQYGKNKTSNGIEFYFGTPLGKQTPFHKMWLASSQQYFHLGCEECQRDFPLYTPGSNKWMEIWIDDDLDENDPDHGFIVKCPHCDHCQNKIEATKRGKWVAYNKNENCKYVGFHLNQLFIPDKKNTRSYVLAQHYDNHPINSAKVWNTEVLGEFYDNDASPITYDEISTACGDRTFGFSQSAAPGQFQKVYLGLDWGDRIDTDSEDSKSASIGRSYTTAVILAEDKNQLKIIYCEKFKRTDPAYKTARIEALVRQYNVDLILADIGHGADMAFTLREKYGERFIACRGQGALTARYKYRTDLSVPEILFDHQYHLERSFSLLKKGLIRFPFMNYEYCGWLVHHCSSMEIKITQDRAGNYQQKYVKGSNPNDGFMALNYCLIGRHFLQTNGFKIVDPKEFRDLSSPEKTMVVGASLPMSGGIGSRSRFRSGR